MKNNSLSYATPKRSSSHWGDFSWVTIFAGFASGIAGLLMMFSSFEGGSLTTWRVGTTLGWLALGLFVSGMGAAIVGLIRRESKLICITGLLTNLSLLILPYVLALR